MSKNSLIEASLFVDGSFLLSINLNIHTLRNEYKLGSLSSKISNYSNQISYYIRKHQDLELYNNWFSNIERENDSLSIIFEDKKIYHKNELLYFYQQAIVRMLDGHYKIDKKRESILIEEFIMSNRSDIQLGHAKRNLFKF